MDDETKGRHLRAESPLRTEPVSGHNPQIDPAGWWESQDRPFVLPSGYLHYVETQAKQVSSPISYSGNAQHSAP